MLSAQRSVVSLRVESGVCFMTCTWLYVSTTWVDGAKKAWCLSFSYLILTVSLRKQDLDALWAGLFLTTLTQNSSSPKPKISKILCRRSGNTWNDFREKKKKSKYNQNKFNKPLKLPCSWNSILFALVFCFVFCTFYLVWFWCFQSRAFEKRRDRHVTVIMWRYRNSNGMKKIT